MKIFYKCITLSVYLLLIIPLYSQATLQWAARYNGTGNGNDRATAIAVDNAGNVYVTGTSEGIGTYSDIVTVKYNSSGDTLWVRRYTGPGNGYDYAGSICVDASGNVYAAGGVYNAAFNYDFILIKYNPAGVQQWAAIYSGPVSNDDVINAMTLDRFGNIYVTGYSKGVSSGFDFATIKYNPAGDTVWVRRYNGSGNSDDYPGAIAVDDTGNVFITGASPGLSGSIDFATIKYSSTGTQLWVSRYNGPGNDDDAPSSLVIDNTDNVYVTGPSVGNGTNQDMATIKYNSTGNTQWIARYNGPDNLNESANSITVDNQGNVYVGGTIENLSSGKDMAVLKYNSQGSQQWVSQYNGTGNGNDVTTSFQIDRDANTYVTGYSFGGVSGNDYATVKFNSAGIMQWSKTFNGELNGSDIPEASAIDSSGNIYITGTSLMTVSAYDYLTIKLSQPIGIHTISTEIPEHFTLMQNYPNPFNPSTKIGFEILKQSFVKLDVFDILGNKVESIVNETLKPGKYNINFDAGNIASGIYYYKLSAGNFEETKKMVLIK